MIDNYTIRTTKDNRYVTMSDKFEFSFTKWKTKAYTYTEGEVKMLYEHLEKQGHKDMEIIQLD